MIHDKHSDRFVCSRSQTKSCLINQIKYRWHTILGTQLHNIDILNYYTHKYVGAIKLLLEFELLYYIEFLLKWNKSIYCQSSSLVLELEE